MAFKALLLASFACVLIPIAASGQERSPKLLTYDELVQLFEQETPPRALRDKLNHLLTTPFVSNAASGRGVTPLVPTTAALGPFLRVVEWNIEEGLEYDAIVSAFTDPASFANLIDAKAYPPRQRAAKTHSAAGRAHETGGRHRAE